MKKNKLQALINLLDDPDASVFKIVEKELRKEPHSIIPVLEEKWETSFDENLQARIEDLIQNLQFKHTKKMLQNWLQSKKKDLLDGFLVVDRFQYPDVNLLAVHQKIETIKKSADRKKAHENLMKNFKLSSVQADAILEMFQFLIGKIITGIGS